MSYAAFNGISITLMIFMAKNQRQYHSLAHLVLPTFRQLPIRSYFVVPQFFR